MKRLRIGQWSMECDGRAQGNIRLFQWKETAVMRAFVLPLIEKENSQKPFFCVWLAKDVKEGKNFHHAWQSEDSQHLCSGRERFFVCVILPIGDSHALCRSNFKDFQWEIEQSNEDLISKQEIFKWPKTGKARMEAFPAGTLSFLFLLYFAFGISWAHRVFLFFFMSQWLTEWVVELCKPRA